MQERGLLMLMHSLIIGGFIYVLMITVFKQSSSVAEDRSLVISALLLLYMIMFGHGMPKKINKNLTI
jgi:hypothetical protein|tara:strand:+ start:8452 stop:8652 length:201 start_codon:yes stop_codon:yes gene_type:complete